MARSISSLSTCALFPWQRCLSKRSLKDFSLRARFREECFCTPEPQCAGIQAVGVELEHGVVELSSGVAARNETLSVLQVKTGFVNRPRVVLELFVLVPCDDVTRPQSRDDIQSIHPRTKAAVCRLGQVLVDSVVDHVARNHEPNRRHVQNSGL